MHTFIVVDTNSLINRARHSVQTDDVTMQTGMALNIIFMSIKKMWNNFNADHIVFCMDSYSWRRDIYPEYKLRRRISQESLTLQEKADNDYFWSVMKRFEDFLHKRTNCTVLKANKIEADDFVARFVDLHPNDHHIIVSSDNDFIQLVNDNVTLYNGVADIFIKNDGVYDAKGNKAFFKIKNNGKLSIPKSTPKNAEIPTLEPGWQKYLLFCLIMRGDADDGVFTAVKPGTRQTKLEEAWQDRYSTGYSWNNVMLEEWEDHNGEKKRVLDRYNLNRMLIDLRAQPQEIIDIMDNTIVNEITNQEDKRQIGTWFIKFCEENDLKRLSTQAKQFANILSHKYPVNELLND